MTAGICAMTVSMDGRIAGIHGSTMKMDFRTGRIPHNRDREKQPLVTKDTIDLAVGGVFK